MTAELEGALQGLSLHSLLITTSKALTRAGFGDVQVLDRRQNRQKSRWGGHELLCECRIGNLPAKVIVKVVRQEVRTRMLDELAGAVRRRDADLGLLVTPFACRMGFRYPGSRVEVVDGPKLASLLAEHGVGVRPSGTPDYAFFEELERVSVRLMKFISSTKR